MSQRVAPDQSQKAWRGKDRGSSNMTSPNLENHVWFNFLDEAKDVARPQHFVDLSAEIQLPVDNFE